MRALFLAIWLISTSFPAFAACSTAKLAGSWYASNANNVCTFNINAKGRASGICNEYSDGAIVSTDHAGIALTLSATCALTGRLFDATNPADFFNIRGRTDAAVTFAVGTMLRVGAFTMTKN